MSNVDNHDPSQMRAYARVDLSLCFKRHRGDKTNQHTQKIKKSVCVVRFCTGNQIFSAKGAVVPWWQRELGLGVAAAVKSGSELSNFLIKSLTSTFLM